LADAFKDTKAKAKPGATIKLRLISNQPAASELVEAFTTRWSGPLAKAGLGSEITKELGRVRFHEMAFRARR
jgi:hypothetical protein